MDLPPGRGRGGGEETNIWGSRQHNYSNRRKHFQLRTIIPQSSCFKGRVTGLEVV